jgi:hypothetical protein
MSATTTSASKLYPAPGQADSPVLDGDVRLGWVGDWKASPCPPALTSASSPGPGCSHPASSPRCGEQKKGS